MYLFLLLVVLLALAAALLSILGKQSASQGALRFTRQEPLFTPAERSFLGALEQALDTRYRIFGKVRLGDMVKPQKGMTLSRATTARNKLNQKHVDFVVCLASDLSVIGAIELDDKSHERNDRAKRDEFVDTALAAAAIPVIHFAAQNAYALGEVKARLSEALKIAVGPAGLSAATVASHPAPPAPSPVQITSPAGLTSPYPLASEHVPQQKTPKCPKCGSSMVKRQAKKGPHAGKFFWACTGFPNCRQVIPLEEL